MTQKELYEKYPSLFRQTTLSKQESCMFWGIECGAGWYNIIDQLSAKLFEIYNDKIEYTQIKEKFGTLRVYVDVLDDSIQFKDVFDIIGEYEVMSSKICEICGAEGKTISTRGWLKTVCETHAKKR